MQPFRTLSHAAAQVCASRPALAPPLPAPLQAALRRGPFTQVALAIVTVAGGDHGRLAALTVQAAAEAERLANANPAAALAAARGVLLVFQAPLHGRPTPPSAVALLTLARLIARPALQAASPRLVGEVAAQLAALAGEPDHCRASPDAAWTVLHQARSVADGPAVRAGAPWALAAVAGRIAALLADPTLPVPARA